MNVVACREAGRARLEACAASVLLSKTGTRLLGQTPITTRSAAALLSSFTFWQEHVQVRNHLFA